MSNHIESRADTKECLDKDAPDPDRIWAALDMGCLNRPDDKLIIAERLAGAMP